VKHITDRGASKVKLCGVEQLSQVDVEDNEHFECVLGKHTQLLIDSWCHCKQARKTAEKQSWDVADFQYGVFSQLMVI